MARPAATIEFLTKLVDWAGGRSAFCRLTNIRPPNLSAYLSGAKSISWKRLELAARHVFGEPPAFVPLVEGWDMSKGLPKVSQVGHEPGIYSFFDSARRTIYFGKATDLYAEIRQTLRRKATGIRDFRGKRNLQFKTITAYLSAFRIIRGDADFRHDVENLGLNVLVNSTLNKHGGRFKRQK